MEAKEVLEQHPLFQDLHSKDPWTLDLGGDMPPFDIHACKTALASSGSYRCGANAFWVDMLRSVVPNVPLNQNSLAKLRQHMFPDSDARWARDASIVVGVTMSDLKNGLPKGELKMISPEEALHGLVLQMAEAVKENKGNLEGWVRIALTCPMTFELVDGQSQRYWKAINSREVLGTRYDTLFRSATQRIFELAAYRKDREEVVGSKLTHKEIYQDWMRNVNFSTLSENDQEKKFKETFVEVALCVYDRLLRHNQLRSIVFRCEDTAGRVKVEMSEADVK